MKSPVLKLFIAWIAVILPLGWGERLGVGLARNGRRKQQGQHGTHGVRTSWLRRLP